MTKAKELFDESIISNIHKSMMLFKEDTDIIKEELDYAEKCHNLEEKLGCSLETVIEHINESYKMLCNHIEIREEYLKSGKCKDITEIMTESEDIAISKEQRGLCKEYFTWLRKDINQ